jgi:hypothetical protein
MMARWKCRGVGVSKIGVSEVGEVREWSSSRWN